MVHVTRIWHERGITSNVADTPKQLKTLKMNEILVNLRKEGKKYVL